jgi:D-methionine transport system substrate-binding protein
MRKNVFALLMTIIALAVSGCAAQEKTPPAATVKVGASSVPHAEILNFIKPELAKEGVNLTVVEMTDYVRPNLAVAEKELDANYFQHIPYLEKFAADHKLALKAVAKVHIEPMGVYSGKIKNLADLPAGAVISIPNDPTNGGRALLLLDKAGIIKLKEGVSVTATAGDIADNPKRVIIKELEAPQLPRSFDDVTLAVINTNYALDAKLSPLKDALFIESADSPYVNVLVVRAGEENRPELRKLAAALHTPAVKKYIEEKYKGAIVPAF